MHIHVSAGLYDIAQEGDWRWVDCSDKNGDNWFPGEPDNYAEQDCGYLQDGFFYDWQCLGLFPYVCEVMDKGEFLLICDFRRKDCENQV